MERIVKRNSPLSYLVDVGVKLTNSSLQHLPEEQEHDISLYISCEELVNL